MGTVATGVRFICPNCGKLAQTQVELPEPHWAAVHPRSKQTAHDQATIICPKCNKEFPAQFSSSASRCDVTLDDYPDTEVRTTYNYPEADDDEDWDVDWEPDYEPPENPYHIYNSSVTQAIELLNASGGDGSHQINRMVFAHIIGALEAFLGDTLINEVMEREGRKLLLLNKDADLSRERVTLAEVHTDPELVDKKIRTHLRSLMYHNIAKVHFLYKEVLQVDVYKMLGENKEHLFKAIEYRHDCVHRNGFDKDGERLEVFTKEYVRSTGIIADTLVTAIYTNLMFSDVLPSASSVKSNH